MSSLEKDKSTDKSTSSENQLEESCQDNSETETMSEYETDPDESYILLSNDELLSESTEDEAQEDYFDPSTEEEQEESKFAWTDSDDEQELREELESEASWLHTEGLPKRICKNVKKISFKYAKHLFTAKCRIKLFNIFKDVKILVDSFNLIYIMKSFEDYKTFKIDFFKITGVCCFNDMILASSSTSSYIKHITLDGKVTDIKKGTGNIRKMVSDTLLYVLGDKLYAFNSNLSLVAEFGHAFIDICVTPTSVIGLTADGDLHMFDKELKFKEKHSSLLKFQFKSIHAVRDMILVGTDTGLIIFDCNFNELKTFSNLKEPITALVYNRDFIVHGSSYTNSLRILNPDLVYYERFPFSKIKLNPITAMAIEGNTVYFTDSRFISSLALEYF